MGKNLGILGIEKKRKKMNDREKKILINLEKSGIWEKWRKKIGEKLGK